MGAIDINIILSTFSYSNFYFTLDHQEVTKTHLSTDVFPNVSQGRRSEDWLWLQWTASLALQYWRWMRNWRRNLGENQVCVFK